MAIAVALLVLLLASPAVHAVTHTVTWTSGVDYTSTANEVYTVGDTIVFNYDSTHSLDQVSASDYASCNPSSPIKSYSDGKTSIPLTTPGPMYFICPTPGHCPGGMKLQINVVAASSTPGTSPTTPSTPGATPTTPSTPDTPPATPSTPGTPNSPPPPPKGNGAASIFANLILGTMLVLGSTIALMG
ncbi:hypothetical protein Tsubulata_002720 [Turnera subulata]|uniref:Phytocyanin domain-containing protein n=1 Tax=Turnera subulata TaxID=218843 RepID=A0A9Q0GD23_9ROSI|nr:hypothetical protein Tsubulata_002720 [Turnera subulata]